MPHNASHTTDTTPTNLHPCLTLCATLPLVCLQVLFIPKEGEPMSVLNTVTGAVLCTLPCTDAEDAYFSPLGTFVVVFSTPKRGTATAEPPANLCIFRVRCSLISAACRRCVCSTTIAFLRQCQYVSLPEL